MRIALVANPNAGRHRALRAADAAEPVFRAAGWQVERLLTTCPGDATRLAREAAAAGFDAVFAAGGDGTLSEVLTGLLDTGVPAGLIPAGTGNDFARTIHLPLEPAAAAAELVRGRPDAIDLLEVNDGNLWAVNIVGTGFDARVCDRINRRKRLLGGRPAYFAALAGEFWSYRSTPVQLRVDDQEWRGDILLLVVANATSYGAGMRISPHSAIDDGLLDVVAVEYMSRLDFLRAFHRVFAGTHLTHPRVHTWRGTSAEVVTPEPSPVLADGDLKTHTPFRVRIAPARAQLWLPPSALQDRT